MLTLQRGGEVCGIHARELDRSSRVWTIPGERVKNHKTHVVPLSPAAVDVLDRAFALAAVVRKRPASDAWEGYAFPSPKPRTQAGQKAPFEQPITRHAFSRAMGRLRVKLKISDATPHDFRRTGSTRITGEQIGIPRFIVSRVLNQISDTGGAAGVTGVYDRNEYLAEKRRALDAWAALLGEIVAGKERMGNVVGMRRA
jgi:integrase